MHHPVAALGGHSTEDRNTQGGGHPWGALAARKCSPRLPWLGRRCVCCLFTQPFICPFIHSLIHSHISSQVHLKAACVPSLELGRPEATRMTSPCPWPLLQSSGTARSISRQSHPGGHVCSKGRVREGAGIPESPAGGTPAHLGQPWGREGVGERWSIWAVLVGLGEGRGGAGPAAMSHGCPHPCPWGS